MMSINSLKGTAIGVWIINNVSLYLAGMMTVITLLDQKLLNGIITIVLLAFWGFTLSVLYKYEEQKNKPY